MLQLPRLRFLPVALVAALTTFLVPLTHALATPAAVGSQVAAGMKVASTGKQQVALVCGNPTPVKRRCEFSVYQTCMADRKDEVVCGLQRHACNQCTVGWLRCTGQAKSKNACEPCHERYWACLTNLGVKREPAQ